MPLHAVTCRYMMLHAVMQVQLEERAEPQNGLAVDEVRCRYTAVILPFHARGGGASAGHRQLST